MHTNLKVQELIDQEGAEGYAVWNLCLEMVGKEGKKGKLDGQKRWQKGLEKVFQWSGNGRMEKILSTLADVKLINSKALKYGNLHIPEFSKRGDDYFRRQLRTITEQDTKKVPLEEIRYIIEEIIDKKRLDVSTVPLKNFVFKRYSKAAKELALLTNGDKELAKKAIDWVSGWCEDKGLNWELETVLKHYISGKSCNFEKTKQEKFI